MTRVRGIRAAEKVGEKMAAGDVVEEQYVGVEGKSLYFVWAGVKLTALSCATSFLETSGPCI